MTETATRKQVHEEVAAYSSPVCDKVKHSLAMLAEWCESEGYKGYDPYDGLNSSLFRTVPFLAGNRLARLAWIQAFKRSPVNLRALTGVKKEYNPKALGLFLSGYCNLYLVERKEEHLEKIRFFSGKLKELQNRSWSGSCWGYNFDWQARAFFQPKNTPTVVATAFIGCALLDAFEVTKDDSLVEMAKSACDFILKDLNRTYDDKGDFAFSYSPLDKTVVFNASLLGSRLLSNVYNYTREEHLAEAAASSARFCCRYQREDGSWSYGTQDFHKWVDNFHTGYNLECLADYSRFTGDRSFDCNMQNGFRYYVDTFFTPEGIPKYYNNSLYPIDIHCSAQLIATLAKVTVFKDHVQLAENVLDWTIDNMQSDKGYFYYQKNRYFTSRIPFMRWAQAWMFYAFSIYLFQVSEIK
jgi:rhamnogalacturonyl hydrolase YesR